MNSALQTVLKRWSDEFESVFPKEQSPDLQNPPLLTSENLEEVSRGLLQLNKNEKDLLIEFLQRLRDTKDYQDVTAKKALLLKVNRILHFASRNVKFREKMCLALHDGLETCGDRVQLTLNEIEIEWQLHQEMSEEERRKLLLRVGRYEKLKEYAQEIARQIGNSNEEIETILYFVLALKDTFDLPITTENMLHPTCASVTGKHLTQAKKYMDSLSEADFLGTSDRWRVHLQENGFEDQIDAITEKYADLLDKCQEYFLIEDSNLVASFLQENHDVNRLLQQAERRGITVQDFNAIAKFIDQLRKEEIGWLGVSSNTAGSVPS